MRSEGKIFQISIKNIFVYLECALLHDAGRVVLDAVAEVAGVGRVGGNLHPVHVELALDVAAAGVGGGGEVGEVSALSSNQRWRQRSARPNINWNWKMAFMKNLLRV